MNDSFESIGGPVPGPRSRALAERLRAVEARGVTYLADDYPVFWDRASGALVVDVDGNRYLDLTSAFGVAAVGHTNPLVAAAVGAQAQRLIHGMGDVHPTEVRVRLLEALAEIAPGDLRTIYLSTSGADAIEFALKTALLATGKPRAIAFQGGYHGLSLGALEVAGIAKFRDPFEPLVSGRATFVRYPDAGTPLERALAMVEQALAADPAAGAIVVEPIQGRGGVIVPPDGFLRELRSLCDHRGLVLIADEIYTGFGRTGELFACDREQVVPDLLCVGKALGGGVPISAVIGTRRIMDAWPASTGEALHTSTFLGNPLACAAALATLEELRELDLVNRVRARSAALGARLHDLHRYRAVRDVRGVGFLRAVEFADGATANRIVVRALAAGLILLQSGPSGTSITIAPPLVIEDAQLSRALELFERTIQREDSS